MNKRTVPEKQLLLTLIVLAIAVFGVVILTVYLIRLPASPVVVVPSDSDSSLPLLDTTAEETETLPPVDSSFVFSFIGDFSPTSLSGGSIFGTFNYYFLDTGATQMIQSLSPYLKEDAFSLCSLAGVLSDNNLTETFINVKPYFHMKGPAAASAVLSASGIEAVAVTNSHCLDYGAVGLSDTIASLSLQNLTPLENQTLYTVNHDGIAIGVLLISSDNSEWSSLNAFVAFAATNYDYLIVYDACTAPLESSTEIRWFYRGLVDQGADLVIGAHGETVFLSELYNGVSIFPAIGSFLTGIEPLSCTFMLRVTFSYENAVIKKATAELIPFKQNSDWTYSSLENTDEGRALLSKIKP